MVDLKVLYSNPPENLKTLVLALGLPPMYSHDEHMAEWRANWRNPYAMS
jgi:hypothetical protein